mgnify:CR=1 FL=1
MKALVLGGNRFFGRRLVAKLLASGADVTLLNRGQHGDPFGSAVRRIQMDRSKLDPNQEQLRDSSWDIVYDQVCYDADEAEAAVNIFAEKTRRYVFVSSQSVYGPDAAIEESAFDPKAHRFAKRVGREVDYSEAKRQAEAVFFGQDRLPVVAVRLPIVLGEDDYTERLKFHVDRIQSRKPIYFPNLDARISFIHAEDAANFLFRLALEKFEGPINCCSPDSIALSELIREIEQYCEERAVYAKDEANGAASPFGIEADWFMSTKKLDDLGFKTRTIASWLPGLIKFYLGK